MYVPDDSQAAPDAAAATPAASTDAQPQAPSMQDVLGGSTPQLPVDVSTTPSLPTMPAPSFAPQPDGKPALWRGILSGALAGLAGSAGSTSFAGGAAKGAAGELDAVQQQKENEMKQAEQASQFKFRDLQAANLAAEANINSIRAHALPGQLQQEHDTNALAFIKNLQDAGVSPSLTIPNTHDSAVAALADMTKANGSVGSVYTVALGDKLVGFNLDQLMNPKTEDDPALTQLVNKAGLLSGRPPISIDAWKSFTPQAKTDILKNSFDAMNIQPPTAENASSLLASATNQLSTYKAQPSQDPAMLSFLQNKVAFYQKAAPQLQQQQASQKAEIAGRETKARAIAADAGAPHSLEPDALGFMPKIGLGGVKQYVKTESSFKKNADDLSGTEQTFQQFGNILKDVNAGKDLTGAQSVVGLFNAIGISAEPLKGKGFRINNSTVEEHSEARGLGETLYQKLLRLKSGDVVTPDQLRDYATIAAQSRENKYVSLVNEAHNAGLNANFLLPTGNGNALDPSTAKIFLRLAGGDQDKAIAAAKAKGWN